MRLKPLRNGRSSFAERRTAAVRRLAATTRGALMLLGLIDHGPAPSATQETTSRRSRERVRSVEVRDLFERFIPEEERVKRLGDVIDRASILALSGDAARGRLSSPPTRPPSARPVTRPATLGETVGPDLTKIGAKYNKAGLLEQILEPSKTIDPHSRPTCWRPRTAGSSPAWPSRRPAGGVVLKDAQGKTVRLASGEIERMVPQSRSLMPELLLRDLTAQQVADLLEFLAGLR